MNRNEDLNGCLQILIFFLGSTVYFRCQNCGIWFYFLSMGSLGIVAETEEIKPAVYPQRVISILI